MTSQNEDSDAVRPAQIYERTEQQPENPFISLIPDQKIATIPFFTLESGETLKNVPLAYSSKGKLSPKGDNAMVICHALTGSADVSDWWGPLLGGPGRAFDVSRFFVICMNSLGSPYGSASPLTYKNNNPEERRYGPEFPLTTIRDDMNIQKLLLDELGVKRIAVAIGGSMGGMLVLEWSYFGKEYVRSIVAIATSSQHSAWGISWGEAQRQSIYADPKYDDGYYSLDDPPAAGLGAARMAALLTYRSRDSFESRFGRHIPDASKNPNGSRVERPSTPEGHWAIHNDGHKTTRSPLSRSASNSNIINPAQQSNPLQTSNGTTQNDDSFASTQPPPPLSSRRPASTYFSAQSYLRYQGQKFVKRFDPNCYIAITRKLDTHDVSRPSTLLPRAATIPEALSQISQPTLVLGIESDGLFTFAEQQELAANIPDSRLKKIESPEGHDAFLLQFEQVNRHTLDFLHEVLPDIMGVPGLVDVESEEGVGKLTKSSTVGEAEVDDMTNW